MIVAIDTETALFGPGRMAPPIACLTYAYQDPQGAMLSGIIVGPDIEPSLVDLLSDDSIDLIGHNIAYDMACITATYPALARMMWRKYELGKVLCTRLGAKLLSIRDGDMLPQYSLAALVKRRWKVDLDKDTYRLGYGELIGKPLSDWPEGSVAYAIKDAEWVWDLHAAHLSEVGDYHDEWLAELRRQSAYDFALKLLSNQGVLIDQGAVKPLLEKARAEIVQGEAVLQAYGFMRPNGTKDLTAVRKAIAEHWRGEGPVPMTDGKRPVVSTSAETVEQCQGHPGLAKMVEVAHVQKFVSTYLEKFEAAGTLPLHGSYDCLGAVSGRTSAFNPNMENQPRQGNIRECVIPRPGCVFVSCDYDSQELRTLAQTCLDLFGYSVLAEKYRADPEYDPHTEFAAQLIGINYAEGLLRKATRDTDFLAMRFRAKAANFGFPGGLGAESFRAYAKAYGVDITYDEARDLKDGWFFAWPEMRDYLRYISDLTEQGGDQGFTIRQAPTGRLRGGCSYCSGANTLFQGRASDATKLALWYVSKAAHTDAASPLSGARPVIFIHDEIIIEVARDRAEQAARELSRVMNAAMDEICPDVPARSSATIMERWGKK